MSAINPYQPPADLRVSSESASPTHYDNPLHGLRGWLILLGISVVVSPLRQLLSLVPFYVGFFKNDVWTSLTTPGLPNYHPALAEYLVFEMGYNGIHLLASIYLAYLFISKKRAFPNWFMGIAFVHLVLVFIDTFIGASVTSDRHGLFERAAPEIIQSLIYGVSWSGYLVMSKRAQVTFVE